MRNSVCISPAMAAALALSFAAVSQAAFADDQAKPIVVHVDGAARIVAPAWEQGREYKFGDFVSYDGFAFKAKSGSAHRRPNANSEVGWEMMNPCDDTSNKAIECEEENQVTAKDGKVDADMQYDKAKQAEGMIRGGL